MEIQQHWKQFLPLKEKYLFIVYSIYYGLVICVGILSNLILLSYFIKYNDFIFVIK